jgi:hypothetical protein
MISTEEFEENLTRFAISIPEQRNSMRECSYKGLEYYFYRWFQYGGFNKYENGIMDGEINIGAILEGKNNRQIKRVYDIESITFKE